MREGTIDLIDLRFFSAQISGSITKTARVSITQFLFLRVRLCRLRRKFQLHHVRRDYFVIYRRQRNESQ